MFDFTGQLVIYITIEVDGEDMISFDCHAHVYDRLVPVRGARYVPEIIAPLNDWLALQRQHGLTGGVIVQVSFLGEDNSQLLEALSGLDRSRFAGIAVFGPDISDAALRALAEANVRGVRWNLVAGAQLPDLSSAAISRFAGRLRECGMHIELQLESDRLAAMLPDLARLKLPVVIDHMGLPHSVRAVDEPWLRGLQELHAREHLFVKLSAPYRGVSDPRAHIDCLTSLLPSERFLWGSDWPHTRFEVKATYAGLLKELTDRIDDATAAAALYGLCAPADRG